MLKNKFKLVSILCLFFSLAACGFHLRGTETISPELKVMYIDAAPYSPLTLALKQTLRSVGVTLVNNPKDAPITLQILNEQFTQQIVNISANTLVNTYNLQYTVTMQLLNSAGQVLYGPVAVRTSSSYAVSDTQIVGDNTQLSVQKQTMQQDAVGLIFNRLNSEDARKAIKSQVIKKNLK